MPLLLLPQCMGRSFRLPQRTCSLSFRRVVNVGDCHQLMEAFPSTTQTVPRHNIFGYHLRCQISDIFVCSRACITMAGDGFVSRWSLPLCLPFAPGHGCLALMWFDITDVDDEWYNTHTMCCVLSSILSKSSHISTHSWRCGHYHFQRRFQGMQVGARRRR